MLSVEGTRDSHSESIIQVTVHNCVNLKSNILLLQPVLCMHVIDVKTGTYVKKSDRNRAVVSFYENQRDDVDYIMPVMTQPCSITGEKFTLSWEEVLILNEDYSMFVSEESSIILFFEIMDFTPISFTKNHYERLSQNGVRKIAWAFLKLVGCNGVINTGSKLCLQLYKPPKLFKKKKASHVEVYEWWLKKSRIPTDASLYISIEGHITFIAEPALRSMLPLQQEKGSTTFDELSVSNKESFFPLPEHCISASSQNTEVTWSRKDGEPCLIPKKKKLMLDVVGYCQVLKFSAHGRILAVGCGYQDCYYLMLYEISGGKLLHKIFAHSDIIYDIDWSCHDKYLISASGDYNVKVWDTKCWSLKETFVHPSYVYNAKFHPTFENLFASSCYDHIIRIWTLEKKCQLLKELEGHNSTVCSLCWNTSGTKLYSADSVGQIKVWRNFKQGKSVVCQLENEINAEEIKGISIYKMVLDRHEQTLCLFCSDSVARVRCFKSGHILSYESASLAPKLSKGCCSPCESLLFLCCDKGNVLVWNRNCEKNDPELLYDFSYGAISCIDYHPHEHMLALSFWAENVPVHIYVHEETGQNKKTNSHGSIQMIPCEEDDNGKCIAVAEKQPTKESHFDVATHSNQNRHCRKKYLPHELKESFVSGSIGMYSSSQHEVNTKKSLAAVITKSGQFDVPDNSACSDSSALSFNKDPVISNQSSKRSQRRKKLKDMHKALS